MTIPAFAPTARAVVLEDFGYRRINVNGQLNLTSRKLLVILVQFGTNGLAHDTNYYDSLVFNRFATNSQSIAGFFNENSNGKFTWLRAGVVGPLPLDDSERQANLPPGLFHSNILHKTISSQLVDFTQFDANGDMTVTDDELEILVTSNDPSNGLRPFGCVRPDPNGIGLCGWLADVGHNRGFATMVHELTHGLGEFEDLYATDCTARITMMKCWSNEGDTFHLDPWHKMQMGWDMPRIRSIRENGVEILAAADSGQIDDTVILYDPYRGTNEFFLLEYRRSGSRYDRDVASSGLAIWHIRHKDDRDVGFVAPFSAGTTTEIGWGECSKCYGLYFQLGENVSRCPDVTGGTNHTGARGILSMVYNNTNDPGQPGWRWCHKCQGLFYGPNQSTSRCPVSGMHDGSQSVNYSLRFTGTNPPYVPLTNWFQCLKCEGLFYGPKQAQSRCPADSLAHNAGASAEYSMWQYDRGVIPLSVPNLTIGNQLWPSNSVTPPLRWIDGARWAHGSPSTTRLTVRAFSPGTAQITVEWTPDRVIWVDFTHVGIENGTFFQPFSSLADGVFFSPEDGLVILKSGSSAETATIRKRLLLRSYAGPATLGQ